MHVALPIILGWIIDGNAGRSELDDRIVEVLDTKPDRAVGVTHALRISDREVRSIRKGIEVCLNTVDPRALEPEGGLNKAGHLRPMLRRGSCKHQPEYAHSRSLWHRLSHPGAGARLRSERDRLRQ